MTFLIILFVIEAIACVIGIILCIKNFRLLDKYGETLGIIALTGMILDIITAIILFI
jgi:hypothetical protein